MHGEIEHMIANIKDLSVLDLCMVYKAKYINVHEDVKIL